MTTAASRLDLRPRARAPRPVPAATARAASAETPDACPRLPAPIGRPRAPLQTPDAPNPPAVLTLLLLAGLPVGPGCTHTPNAAAHAGSSLGRPLAEFSGIASVSNRFLRRSLRLELQGSFNGCLRALRSQH